MTQTIREQLQALVDYCDANRSVAESRWIVGRIESILATEPPAVAHRCNICGGLVQFDGTKPSVSIGPGGKQQ